jgi:hypothetical protein
MNFDAGIDTFAILTAVPRFVDSAIHRRTEVSVEKILCAGIFTFGGAAG